MASQPQNPAIPWKPTTAPMAWLMGAGGLLVYLITLNHWVSLYSLGSVARVSGWTWQPQLSSPLTAVIFLPFKCLPASWIPLTLNLFTALCAALVLALLARSVSLLPHDLAPEQSFPPRPGAPPASRITHHASLLTRYAWLPALIAVLLCGLQLSFWEHATSFTGEMIDLLVFAFVIRCLLEFRIDQDDSWLSRSALIYGAGMANNWALVGFLPIFFAAAIRVKGIGLIFNWRMLLHLALWGMAGLSLYLLLPLIQSLSSTVHVDFWPALKANIKLQKEALGALRQPHFRLLAITSLLPLLVLSIRWKSHTMQFSDDSPLGVFLTKTMVHFVHALFLVIALWLALDPSFAPRNLGIGPPMLTYYYLSALVAGYCAGHFLLFGSKGFENRISKPALGTLCVLACGLLLALGARNLGQIRATNGPALHEFARQLYAELPPGKSLVLSDSLEQLSLLRAELAASGPLKEVLPLEANSLVLTQYQSFMAARFASKWPAATPTNKPGTLGPLKLLNLITELDPGQQVVYLQPSFGHFFERFTDRPNGLVHYLEPRAASANEKRSAESGIPEHVATMAASDKGLADSVVSANEQIWHQRWSNSLEALAAKTKQNVRGGPESVTSLLRRLHLAPYQNATLSFLGAAYSKSLNDWGVQLQRLGRWPEAGLWFGRALELNPVNLAAQVNLAYNARCQQGDRTRLDNNAVQNQYKDMFDRYHNWLEVLNSNGPVDEPTVLCKIARGLLAGRNNHQAVRDLARCVELAPDWLEPKLWLALGYIDLRDFSSVLETTERINASVPPPTGKDLSQVLFCRTTALRGIGKTNEAAAAMESFLTQHQQETALLSATAELFAQNQQFEPALVFLEPLLKQTPNDPKLLARKGLAQVELSKYDAAIATLTAALTLVPNDEEARLQRAVACMGAGQLEAARADYQELLKTSKHAPNALYGLGSIAWRTHDTNAAIRFYQQYLSNSTPDSAQKNLASNRLKQLGALSKR